MHRAKSRIGGYEMSEKKIISVGSITAMPCKWSVGKTLEHFLAGLQEGKLLGVKCGECGKVYVPPQQLCSKCFKEIGEWTELSGEGEVVNYTVAHVDVRNKPLDTPEVIAMVKLDGADTALYGRIKGAQAGPDMVGTKVKAVYRDERKGNIRDITHYEPV